MCALEWLNFYCKGGFVTWTFTYLLLYIDWRRTTWPLRWRYRGLHQQPSHHLSCSQSCSWRNITRLWHQKPARLTDAVYLHINSAHLLTTSTRSRSTVIVSDFVFLLISIFCFFCTRIAIHHANAANFTFHRRLSITNKCRRILKDPNVSYFSTIYEYNEYIPLW